MIKPIGHRAVVRPIVEDDTERLIVEANPDTPNIAEVVSVGRGRCGECRSPLELAVEPGMRVILRPFAPYQETTSDSGEVCWLVSLDDVIGEVEPIEA